LLYFLSVPLVDTLPSHQPQQLQPQQMNSMMQWRRLVCGSRSPCRRYEWQKKKKKQRKGGLDPPSAELLLWWEVRLVKVSLHVCAWALGWQHSVYSLLFGG